MKTRQFIVAALAVVLLVLTFLMCVSSKEATAVFQFRKKNKLFFLKEIFNIIH